MGQKKLQRFAELETFSNVLQFPLDIEGRWKEVFGNGHPITLELACGKGEYTVGLAKMFPQRNFIGVDLKGNRIWVGARKALAASLKNVAFLRTQIELIDKYFEREEVSDIWITFPDPQLRSSKAKKRLTHPRFLRLYRKILRPNGCIHLKTDSPELFHFTRLVADQYECKVVDMREDVYANASLPEELKIKTHYESLDIAGHNKVHYISFTLPEKIPAEEKDAELKILAEKMEG